MKPTTPSRETDALIADEEQNGKQKGIKGKKQGTGPTQLPWTTQSSPTTGRDHTASLFFVPDLPLNRTGLIFIHNVVQGREH